MSTTFETPPANAGAADAPERRGFLKKLGAFGIGAAAILTPVAAGLRAALAPVLSPRTREADFVRVTTLAALPVGGPPQRFTIVKDRVNAWSRLPAEPVGAVYLRRTAETAVEAFNVVCPHAGCNVSYAPGSESFLCPCHNSTFALDGRINDPKSPSPRGLDALAVEVRDGAVWVRFQSFRTGLGEKTPV